MENVLRDRGWNWIALDLTRAQPWPGIWPVTMLLAAALPCFLQRHLNTKDACPIRCDGAFSECTCERA